MVGKTSVVTAERFALGLTYKEYIAQIKVNKDQFQRFYDECQIKADDAEFFRRAVRQGATRLLVLGEDWCPDVYRGMPTMARLAEAAGMEMRVFPRDQNMDIMNEFLNQGQFQSIPVAVFYTKEMKYLCHWIERPALANKERAQIEEEVKKALPGAEDQAIRAEVRTRTQAKFPSWQQESIREMRQMVSEKLRAK